MAYLVFARKYRPQQFDDVIGQAHITRSLANAVTTGRLAHAILFSGPRGTGKTTVARILAKCVNCHNGPTDKPCNQCPSCREITTSSAADVFEIDGASNNKVENVRELRETAKYKPSSSPYKIFIIDEVHMLSDAAFNALLKTLEEPPAHVLFFFATTEPNKIPVTILSRCQRYDFRRVAIDDITGHMAEICRQEQMQISQNALAVIAREADGSIRDGLSLLDQIVTCSSEKVSDEQVVEMLGVIDRQVLFDAADALFSGNAAALVGICDALYRQGRHLLRFYSELIVHFRNLLLIKMGGAEKSLTDVPEHEKKQMAKQVEHVSEPYLSQIVNTLFSDEWRIRQSVSPRHALEMTFFKLLQIRPAMSMDTLIEKLDQLRQEMGGPLPVNAVPEAASEPRNPEPAALPENQDPGPGPVPEPETAPEPEPEPDGPETASTPEDPADGYETNEALWAALKNHIAAQKPSLAACMGESQLREINGRHLVIDIKSSGSNIELLDRKKNITRMEQLCSEFLEKNVRVELNISREANHSEKRKQEAKTLREEALNHPLVDAAVKTFNGKIVDIKILPAGGSTQ
ncbi:MAG: DNA polymerase III subunit gamma/tau [Desulfobacteraceae bacterium]|nr:DNA polymerase III subunit gamma/tau [Desulfobacteraceae bacterium]